MLANTIPLMLAQTYFSTRKHAQMHTLQTSDDMAELVQIEDIKDAIIHELCTHSH